MDTIANVSSIARSMVWGPDDNITQHIVVDSVDSEIDTLLCKKKKILRDLRSCATEQRAIDAASTELDAAYTISRSELGQQRGTTASRIAELEAELALVDEEARVQAPSRALMFFKKT